ncbi:hypothetical protein L211DRAFT_853116 [Terfezia boudieri ATCC MYA-4762]|uniref:Uncharacterized protein n=1 Tax=Terfezia boudieri ATCC MYA-4762 TaxID=1051890 RepID=A0A3N4LDB5_9PEZI|nr:hypothetical protein L211DRAFT_853116 [Terfezia boudieri ATCC MYA-4762]
MRNVSMSQDQVMLKIAPEMRCIEVPLSGVMLSTLYSAVSPGWCYTSSSTGFNNTRIKIFHENGVEIPLGAWEDVVHAGMVAVIEFIPTVTDRRWSEPACLEPPLSRAEEIQISPTAMSPPHKSVSLERYPSSRRFTTNRPGNIRIHNLPSISEHSNQVVDEDQHMFPRSVTPLPSPQPWKLLFNRAKLRGQEKGEKDYFSNRPVQPTLSRRWSEPSWVSAEDITVQAEFSQQSMDGTMDIDMSGAEDAIEERTFEPQPNHEMLAWRSFEHQTATIQPATDLFTLQSPVSFTSKRKRNYSAESEDDGEDVCRRTVKRTMASYHRRQLHGVLQAV